MAYFAEADGRNKVITVSPYKEKKYVYKYELVSETRGLKSFIKAIKRDYQLSQLLGDIKTNCFISSFKTPDIFLDCCKELAREFNKYSVIDSEKTFTVIIPYGKLEFDKKDRTAKIYKKIKANPL
ncbi:hypothetical protein [Intestinibacter bartlettii]|uniref:hypothetical protein n=1 Tax=Intestinibacter bartlettii TaxID=261299 RepID=UPI003AB2F240